MLQTRQTKDLPCRLTAEEMDTKATDLVDRMDELENLKVEAKAKAEQYKKDGAAIESGIGKLQTIIRSHSEPRPVECAVIPYYSAFAIVTVRLDSGAEVSRRPMTEQERTPGLFSGSGTQAAEGEEVVKNEEEVENDRIIARLELSDLLRQIEYELNMESLWEIGDTDIDDARRWAATVQSLQEGEEKPEAPTFLTELIEQTKQAEASQAEHDSLVRRTCELLDESKLVVDHILVATWSPEQLNEASDYAQCLIDGRPEETMPERPSFLPAPPSDPANGQAAAAA